MQKYAATIIALILGLAVSTPVSAANQRRTVTTAARSATADLVVKRLNAPHLGKRLLSGREQYALFRVSNIGGETAQRVVLVFSFSPQMKPQIDYAQIHGIQSFCRYRGGRLLVCGLSGRIDIEPHSSRLVKIYFVTRQPALGQLVGLQAKTSSSEPGKLKLNNKASVGFDVVPQRAKRIYFQPVKTDYAQCGTFTMAITPPVGFPAYLFIPARKSSQQFKGQLKVTAVSGVTFANGATKASWDPKKVQTIEYSQNQDGTYGFEAKVESCFTADLSDTANPPRIMVEIKTFNAPHYLIKAHFSPAVDYWVVDGPESA